MLTLRFESDARTPEGDIVWITEVPDFRVYTPQGVPSIAIKNEHGVEIHHLISGDEGSYDRCYVMNSSGHTVAKFVYSGIETISAPKKRPDHR